MWHAQSAVARARRYRRNGGIAGSVMEIVGVTWRDADIKSAYLCNASAAAALLHRGIWLRRNAA